MSNHKESLWNTDQLLDLPYSGRVNIPVFSRLFTDTTTSYKYLFFLSLLDILEDNSFETSVIPLKDILLEMLTNAWFSHNYFKLSFGISDRITRELNTLKISVNSDIKIYGAGGKKRVRKIIASKNYTNNNLLNMVPYRLLTPFFEKELKGLTDSKKNKRIIDLAYNKLESSKPIYFFSENHQSIILKHDWLLYFYENFNVVRSFVSWNWLDYMQRRNPSVPNLQKKLFPPDIRESIGQQKKYWKHIMTVSPLTCIFSGKPIQSSDLSIDHFLPWSFVAHDQLWNLIPVSKSINSSKSNNLPSLDRYFRKFVDLQHKGLSIYHNNPGNISWNKVIEPYLTDLRIEGKDILDINRLKQSLSSTINPLHSLAVTQGFSSDWIYNLS